MGHKNIALQAYSAWAISLISLVKVMRERTYNFHLQMCLGFSERNDMQMGTIVVYVILCGS